VWHGKLLGGGLTEGDKSEVLFKLVLPQPVHNQVLLHRGGHCLRACRRKHAAARREPPSTSTLLPARPRGAAATATRSCKDKRRVSRVGRALSHRGTRGQKKIAREHRAARHQRSSCPLRSANGRGPNRVSNRGFKSLSASHASSAGARRERRRRRAAQQPNCRNESALTHSCTRNAPLCTPSFATLLKPAPRLSHGFVAGGVHPRLFEGPF
jgi:hypothetical protein